MKKKWIVLFALIITVVLFLPIQRVLVFEYENSKKVLGYIPIEKTRAFAVKYTHSIHLSDVKETYKLNEEGQIVQEQLEYEDFAIGMPSDAQGDETFVEKDGRYIIGNMNRTFDYVDLRIGQVIANHTLIYRQQHIPFASFVNEGSWIRIDYRLISLWEMLKGVNILEQREGKQ
jgi:hypothetical protein